MKFSLPYPSPRICSFKKGMEGGIHPQPSAKSGSRDTILPGTRFVVTSIHRLQSLVRSLRTVQ